MSVNAYLALTVVVLFLMLPVILVTSPIWLIWVVLQKLQQRRRGYQRLWPYMARTSRLYAEAMIEGDAPGGDWENVPRNLDKYIAATISPRIWRLRLVITAMEVAPVIRFRLPFSMLSAKARKDFVERYLVEPKGVMRIPSLGRQLMRLGYYATPQTHEEIGFARMAERAAWRRKHAKDKELTSV
jgi:hypothetical protein